MESMAANSRQKLFKSHVEPVLKAAYGTAFYLTGCPTSSERLVHAAAVRAFKDFSSYSPETRFKTWFLRILVTVIRDNACHGVRQVTPGHARARRATDGSPMQRSEDRAERAIVEAFARLPETDRLVTALYFLEELSYQEIADIVGCSFETVRARLHRGRRTLAHSVLSATPERGYVSA